MGTIQGQQLQQYDFTPQQYEALAKLTATLCTIFPNIRCDYPRDASGALRREKLPDADYERLSGYFGALSRADEQSRSGSGLSVGSTDRFIS